MQQRQVKVVFYLGLERGKMVEEFENASFALAQNGDVSDPFLSSYGWHIVKRLGFKGLVSFDEVKNSLKKKVSRDSRADKTRSSFLNKLKSEYGIHSRGGVVYRT